MEEYNELEKVEELFKQVCCFGTYNYCFSCQTEQLNMFGAIGALISIAKNKKVMGYFLNKNENGICLIPIVMDTLNKNKVDLDHYKFIKQEDIKSIKIKNEDFVFKKISITLNDGTKYKLKTVKKMKNANYHEINLNKFIDSCVSEK